MTIPKRVRILRKVDKKRKGVVVFGRKGEEYVFKFGSKPGDCLSLGVAEGLSLFEAEVNEEAQKTSIDFNAIYSQMKDKLFSKKTEVALDQGKREAILKVEALIEKAPEIKDYLNDLLKVIKELDSLPDRYARLIRKINLDKLQDDLKELQEQVPHDYLSSIIQRVQEIDEEEESLILSEELPNG